ncbi:MAG TPA: ROK family protein [Blastocatellia bacterium]|nr:ROK family protein [Blastocatellia bacterium]
MKEPLYLGVDLGGTQLRIAAVTGDGKLATGVLSVPTGKSFSPDDLRRQLTSLTAELRQQSGAGQFAALGIGVTGIVRQGRLSASDFLPQLNDLELADTLSSVVGCPVAVENDARCFTLAEARFGAGRGAHNICGITLGTGVGGGVMVDGQLVRGVSSQAGEVWSIPLRGRHLEYFLSGDGVVRGYLAEGGGAGESSASQPDSARIADLARGGDPAARAAWAAFGDDLYFLCGAMIALLEPEVIVIGGSLTKASDLYFDDVMARLSQWKTQTRIACAELGGAAGLIGAAALNIQAGRQK